MKPPIFERLDTGGFDDVLVKLIKREQPDDPASPIEYEMDIKWDGCVHLFRRWKNFGATDDDYLHICNYPEFVEMIVEANKLAAGHFGHGSYWHEHWCKT